MRCGKTNPQKNYALKTTIAILLTMCVIGSTAAAQAEKARLHGRLSNGEGAPVPDAIVVVCNSDANLWFLTSTDAQGTFEFPELPANRFAIEVLSPQWRRSSRDPSRAQVWGFSPWSDTIALQPGQRLERNIQLGNLTLQPRISQTSPPCTPRRHFLLLSSVALERLLIEGTSPVYPQNARSTNVESEVNLEAFMNKDGEVISLRVVVASWPPQIDPQLTKTAVEAVRSWRYTPPRTSQGEFEFGGLIAVKFSH
jgi:TonB family protein